MEHAGPENFAKWVDFNIYSMFRHISKLDNAMPSGFDWVTYTEQEGVIISLNRWKRDYTDRYFNPGKFAVNSKRLADQAVKAVASTAQRRRMDNVKVAITIRCGLLQATYYYLIYEKKGPVINMMETSLLPNGEA